MVSPVLDFGHVHDGKSGCLKLKKRMADSVYPDKSSYLELHCLHRYMFRTTELNGLMPTWI